MLTFLDILFSCIVLTTGQTLSISPNPVIEGQPFTLKCSVSIDGAITFSHENIVRESCPAPFGTTLFPCSDTSIQQSIAAMETIWTVQSANSTTDEGNWKCSKGSDSPVVYLTVSSVDTTTESLTTTDIETTTFQLSTTTQKRETTAATNSESTDSTNSETTTSTNSETTASINSESTALTNSETSVSTNSKTTVATNSGTTGASNSRTTAVSYSVTTATSSSRTTVASNSETTSASNSVTSIVGNNSINIVDNQSAETVLIVSTVIPIGGMIILFIATLATICTVRKRKENKDDLETSDKRSNVRKEHIYQSESSRKTHVYNQHKYSYTGRNDKRPERLYNYTNYYPSSRQMIANQHATPYYSRCLPVAFNPSYMHSNHGPGIQDYRFYTGNAYFVPDEDY